MKRNFFFSALMSVAVMSMWACGDSSSGSSESELKDSSSSIESKPTSNTGSASSGSSNGSEDTGSAVISNLKLSGVTQKGPFAIGSQVTAHELENGKTLAQTGRVYSGDISGKDGLFNVNVVALASQYVLLRGSGTYMNEVTGKLSDKDLNLNAITDLTERSRANINLLTHLEYYRVQKLVAEKKKSLADAKEQAEKEIFDAFYVNSKNFGSTEDLNIFSKGEDNAALLAISILLQRDNSASALGVELAQLSTDIAEDGTWDDEETRMKVAAWADSVDLNGKLGDLRKNVEGWKLGDVPHFEKYIRRYWSEEYGLGVCGSKEIPVGTVAAMINKDAHGGKYYASDFDDISNTKERFICDNADSAKWRFAKDQEKDTWGSKCDDGFVTDFNGKKSLYLNGRINSNAMYVCEDGKFRTATDIERTFNYYRCSADDKMLHYSEGEPTANNPEVKETFEKTWMIQDPMDGSFYLCDGGKFRVATAQEADTRAYLPGENGAVTDLTKNNVFGPGELIPGRTSGKSYVYDDGKFREATLLETVAAKKGCVSYSPSYGLDASSAMLDLDCTPGEGWSIRYGEIDDHRDGRKYATVRIVGQTWMAENLRFAQSFTLDPGYYPFGKSENVETLGLLYTWDEAMNTNGSCPWNSKCPLSGSQGLCPSGFHVPTIQDWETLKQSVSNSPIVSTTVKAALASPSWEGVDADNITGFSALPTSDEAGGKILTSLWWTSNNDTNGNCNEDPYSCANYVGLYSDDEDLIVNSNTMEKRVRLSVRCVKNN